MDRLERDERIGALLRESAPQTELLSREQLSALVASAPPAKQAWYALLLKSPAPLRYALAPFALLFMLSIALSVVPAQSMQVGTMVYTMLPTDWERSSTAFAEVQAQSVREFAGLSLPQGVLHIFTAELAGRDQLVFTLVDADRVAAESFMQRLNARYPMLEAFRQDYVDMQTSPGGSRLAQLVQQVQHGARQGLDETQLARQVLGALHSAGLTGLDVSYETLADGSRVVRIEGEFSMQIQGHLQEEPAQWTGGAAAKADPAELLLMLGAASR